MQSHVFEGYFENGTFYSNDRQVIKIPERRRINITVLDEPIDATLQAGLQKKRPFSELYGKYKGQILMSDDFDEPLEEMREYME